MIHFEGLFSNILLYLKTRLVNSGEEVRQIRWQSVDVVGTPAEATIELRNVGFTYKIPSTITELQLEVVPNLPWAEEHFKERVSGDPLNPGAQYKNWPYYKGNVEKHQTQEDAAFSHTYMERFWPKYAARSDDIPNWGLRFGYGDLDDVIDLLIRDPGTRQAYLPVWFPEDTGAAHGERVPCTLGYHFMYRWGRLHCNYFIRSCDMIRHFQDDVYLACRLTQWMCWELKARKFGGICQPGNLEMFIGSFHVFKPDLPRLEKELRVG